MLNNLTNFFNLIVGRRIKTQLENDDLISIGTKQSPALGDYKPTAIKYEDLKKSISVAWGNITGTLSTQTDLQNALNAKQNTLVSGTNIKTINSTSLLGSGDVAVQPTLVSGTNIKTINGNSVLGSGNLVVSGAASWGGITGTLSAQLDLQSALNGKNNLISHLQFNNTNKTIWNQGNSSNSLSYGINALGSVTSALNCTAIGNGALQSLTSGNTNVALGTNALQTCTTGTLNTAVGPFAQLALTTGIHNTSMGYRSLRNVSTGSYNIAIGNDCFLNNTTGSANIGIGFNINSNNWNNGMALGHNVAFSGDNQIHFGSSGNTLGVVTTESVTQAQTWTVFINGVQRKILLA